MESCLITLLMLLPSGNPWALAGEPEPQRFQLADSRQQEKTIPNHQAVLVFTAKWCGPCKQMVQSTYPPLRQRGWRVSEYGVTSEKDPHVILIDVDRHPELMKSFTVTQLPTIVSWTGRSESARRIGYLDAYGIGDAWNRSRRKASAAPVQTQRYRARWTYPGDSRDDLIKHLSGANHGYSVESLQRLSTDELFRLHDSDHDRPRAKLSLPFIQFSDG